MGAVSSKTTGRSGGRLERAFSARSILAALATIGAASIGEARAAELVPAAPSTSTWGLRGTGGIGTAAAGDYLMFELGADLRGWSLRGADGGWLARWDGWAVARGGELANEHPFMFLLGGRERVAVAAGRRFSKAKPWSPYAGLLLDQEARWLFHPGLSPSGLDTVNNVDGVAGTGLLASGRVEGGVSFVNGSVFFLATAFVGEQLQRAERTLPAFAFTLGGVAMRVDGWRGFTVDAEAWWGFSPVYRDAARGFTDRTFRTHVDALVRHTLGHRAWLGLWSSWTRDSDRLMYDAGAFGLSTADAPAFTLVLAGGMTLGAGR